MERYDTNTRNTQTLNPESTDEEKYITFKIATFEELDFCHLSH